LAKHIEDASLQIQFLYRNAHLSLINYYSIGRNWKTGGENRKE